MPLENNGSIIETEEKQMKKNVGPADRAIRIVAGVLVLALFGITDGNIRWVFLVLGAILIVTGVVRFCPLYLPFGIDTNKIKRKI